MTALFHPRLPQDVSFYTRVLDLIPTPIIVIGSDATIRYGNSAMIELSGWGVDDAVGSSVFDVIHPDDRDEATAAFLAVLGDEESLTANGAHWSPIRFRIVRRDGSALLVEVLGRPALDVPDIDGLIYAVRSCRDDELLGSVLAGIASHHPVAASARPLIDRLSLAPNEFESAVFEQFADGSAVLVATTHPALAALPMWSNVPVPWTGLATEPAKVDLDWLPRDVSDTLRSAGFASCFHTGVHAPDHSSTLRLIACSRHRHASARGPLTAIGQARELLSIIAVKAQNDRLLANHANRDSLTGLPNRLGLAHRLERLTQTSDDCAVMFVDLDDFKGINDEFGHLAGDHVLSAVADRIVRTVRTDDFVCRLGGDEFAVVLAAPESRLTRDSIEFLADRIVAILSEPVLIDGATVALSASVGVATAGRPRDLDTVMARADAAMYRAKRAGGARSHLDLGPS